MEFDLELRENAPSIHFDSALDFDSALEPSFPEWTRAHIDVVLPTVFSNLGWTVIGPAYEHTHRKLVSRRLAVMRRSKAATWRHIARIDGYAHINVTSARAMASRMPGVAPAKVDEEMGLAGITPLTAKSWRDRLWYPIAILGAMRMPLLFPFDLWRQRRAVARLEAADLSAMSDEELIGWVEQARRRLITVCLAHYVARLFSTPAMEKLDAVTPESDLARGLLADLDDLEATAPTLALLELSQQESGPTEGAIDEFLTSYGHRGNSELDPGASVWADDRERLRRRAVELAGSDGGAILARRQAVRAEAEDRLGRLSRLQRTRIGLIAKACRRVSTLGEETKDNLVRATHSVRLALQELARRAGIDYDDAVLLGWSELVEAVTTGSVEADFEQRRGAFAHARRSRPALYRREDTDFVLPDVETTEELRGIAASPGRTTGRAVVVDDPLAGDITDGEILVAHATDTSWTHLFLTYDAVVAETGDLLSHSSVVARDLGIPAVVAVPEATGRIPTGQTTTVDGDEGLVTVG